MEAEIINKYKTGFKTGDHLLIEQNNPERYVIVVNNGKKFIIAINGERREQIIRNDWIFFLPPLNKKALKGNLSLNEII